MIGKRIRMTNFNAAYGALQVGLELIEAAKKFEAIDLDVLRSGKAAKGD